MRLDVDEVSFSYGPGLRTVLDGVSFSYESPEVLCILGGNGQGKSTLLQCIVGAFRIAGGSVRIDGVAVGDWKPRDLARKIAYIPQGHVPSFGYPVLDVVAMGRTSRMGRFASPGERDRACALEQLAYLGIAHLAKTPYTAISGGERQLAALRHRGACAPRGRAGGLRARAACVMRACRGCARSPRFTCGIHVLIGTGNGGPDSFCSMGS